MPWTLQEEAFKLINQNNIYITLAKDINASGSKLYQSFLYDEIKLNKLLKTNNYLYEVIRVDLSRKFYIDIDISSEYENYNKYTNEDIIKACNEIVKYSMKLIDSEYILNYDEIKILYVAKSDKKQSIPPRPLRGVRFAHNLLYFTRLSCLDNT
jgi:hypothetical protein